MLLNSLIILMIMFGIQISANAMGFFYTDATYPITATGAQVKDLTKLKKGSASTTNILWFVEVGDAGIDEAAKKAGITKISHIDVNEKSVLIFWR